MSRRSIQSLLVYAENSEFEQCETTTYEATDIRDRYLKNNSKCLALLD